MARSMGGMTRGLQIPDSSESEEEGMMGSMPGMGGMGGMGGVTGMPGMGGVTGMPGMGGVTGMPGMPGMGGVPGMGGMGGFRGGPMQRTPFSDSDEEADFTKRRAAMQMQASMQGSMGGLMPQAAPAPPAPKPKVKKDKKKKNKKNKRDKDRKSKKDREHKHHSKRKSRSRSHSRSHSVPPSSPVARPSSAGFGGSTRLPRFGHIVKTGNLYVRRAVGHDTGEAITKGQIICLLGDPQEDNGTEWFDVYTVSRETGRRINNVYIPAKNLTNFFTVAPAEDSAGEESGGSDSDESDLFSDESDEERVVTRSSKKTRSRVAKNKDSTSARISDIIRKKYRR